MAQVTLAFSRDNNDRSACIDYAWISSGKRSTLVLQQGEFSISKIEEIQDDQTIVNVFALNDKDFGLVQPWQSSASQLGINLALFQVVGGNIVRTIFYRDGSIHTSSQSKQQNP